MASARLKVSKSEARYQSFPKGDKWCNKCTMWRHPNSCSKVQGAIHLTGYCRFYFPKGAK